MLSSLVSCVPSPPAGGGQNCSHTLRSFHPCPLFSPGTNSRGCVPSLFPTTSSLYGVLRFFQGSLLLGQGPPAASSLVFAGHSNPFQVSTQKLPKLPFTFLICLTYPPNEEIDDQPVTEQHMNACTRSYPRARGVRFLL